MRIFTAVKFFYNVMFVGNTLALRTVLFMYVQVCEVLNSVAFWLATALMSWVQFLAGDGIFLFAIMFRQSLGLTHRAVTGSHF